MVAKQAGTRYCFAMGRPQKQLAKRPIHHCLQLLRMVIKKLGVRYYYFLFGFFVFSMTALLPPKLFHFFTNSVQGLQQMEAIALLKDVALFGFMVAIACSIAKIGGIFLQEWLRLNTGKILKLEVIENLYRKPIEVLDQSGRGEWLTRMTEDLKSAEGFLTDELPNQLRDCFVLLGTSAMFLHHSGPAALVVLVTGFAIGGTNIFLQKRIGPLLFEMRQLRSELFQLLIENFEGIRTIRNRGAEKFTKSSFGKKIDEIVSKGLRMIRSLGSLMSVSEFYAQLIVTGILCLLIYLLRDGKLTVAETLIYPFYIGIFFDSAKGIVSAGYAWNRFIADGGRLAQMLFDEDSGKKFFESKSLVLTSDQINSLSRIHLSSLEIGHPGKDPLAKVSNLSFDVGKLTAIVGPSGCGKSTLLEVLAGLRSALAGKGSFQTEDQRELLKFDSTVPFKFPADLMTYVEQRPYIFSGTVAENLTLGNQALHQAKEIDQVLKQVDLFKVFERRDGPETLLVDRGANLSEGQRYRIGLARGFLSRRPIMVIDEPFAALDEETIKLVVKNLNRFKQNHAVIVVTHLIPEGFEVDQTVDFSKF